MVHLVENANTFHTSGEDPLVQRRTFHSRPRPLQRTALPGAAHPAHFDSPVTERLFHHGHVVPVGSAFATIARSIMFTTPSALASARGSNPVCPMLLPNDAFTMSKSAQFTTPSPLRSPAIMVMVEAEPGVAA